MLTRAWRFWPLFLAVLLIGATVWSAERSSDFRSCVKLTSAANGDKKSDNGDATIASASHIYRDCVGQFVVKNNPAITAVSTFIIAIFTIVLAGVTDRQARLTKEAFVADKRAFVYASGFHPRWEQDPDTGAFNWRFSPFWQNSGDTPTRNLRLSVMGEVRSTRLPPGFNFDYSPTPPGPGMLGPKSGANGGAAPLPPVAAVTPQDIIDAQRGRKFIYVWGWARYFDAFPDTPEHITRFCWLITATGDPHAYDPNRAPGQNGNLMFFNMMHTEGNCADDECS